MTVIKRMISSWFGAAFVLLMILSKHDLSPIFPDKSFASDFNIIIFLLLAAALFILITFLKRFSEHIPTDNIALTISVGLYATALSYKAENISVALALTVGIAIPLFYVMYRDRSMLSSLTLSRRSGIICASVIALFMAIFIAAITCARYLTFSAPNYDFGIFCNMFANMARDFTQTVSSERDAIIQHFKVHFSLPFSADTSDIAGADSSLRYYSSVFYQPQARAVTAFRSFSLRRLRTVSCSVRRMYVRSARKLLSCSALTMVILCCRAQRPHGQNPYVCICSSYAVR